MENHGNRCKRTCFAGKMQWRTPCPIPRHFSAKSPIGGENWMHLELAACEHGNRWYLKHSWFGDTGIHFFSSVIKSKSSGLWKSWLSQMQDWPETFFCIKLLTAEIFRTRYLDWPKRHPSGSSLEEPRNTLLELIPGTRGFDSWKSWQKSHGQLVTYYMDDDVFNYPWT